MTLESVNKILHSDPQYHQFENRWRNGATKAIQVPASLADRILEYARELDKLPLVSRNLQLDCEKCGGKLESKGVRRETRRYRCTVCKANAGSVPLTEKEIITLKAKDKGIGNLSLVEREKEIAGLSAVKKSYALLPAYDPKYCNKFDKRLNRDRAILNL